MKYWMKQLENSFSVNSDTFNDEEYEVIPIKEDKKVLKSILKTCKADGIDTYYVDESGTIVVDDIANLIRY